MKAFKQGMQLPDVPRGGPSDGRVGVGEEGGKYGNILGHATSVSQVRANENLQWTSVMFASWIHSFIHL